MSPHPLRSPLPPAAAKPASPVRRAGARLLLAPALALAACAEEAPEEPTWADVAPILAAHCVRCHGAPAIGGAPATFRLDRYDDVAAEPDLFAAEPAARRVLGAAAMAEWIAERAADGSMPPRFPLAQHDRDVLSRWFETRPAAVDGEPGAGLPRRGPARPGDQPPDFTVSAAAGDGGDLALAYELRDPDRDLVTGQLLASLVGAGAEPRSLGELRAGRGTLRLDTALLPAGDYRLDALLDDGDGPVRRPATTITVTPPSPAPPRLALIAPEQGDYVAAAELPLELEVLARDVDTAQLSITATLVDDRAVAAPVASRTLAVAAGSRTRLTLGDADLPAGLTYRVVAEVSDGAATHRVQGGRFRVAGEAADAPTTDSFQSIADDILAPYCLRCHASATRVPNLTIDLTRYRGTAERPGVYELRRRIYHRAVVAQSMPPGSARRAGGELPAAERERLARWLLAGAPEVAP
jgi:hypothetical protein